MTTTRPRRVPTTTARRAAAGIALALLLGAGCSPYRIEYHERPEFYAKASETALPDEVTLADGTRVVYETRSMRGKLQERASDESRPFLIREIEEDGGVVVRALLPEHVIANVVLCLRNEEYGVIYDQILAEETRLAYEEGPGRAACESFFRRNRKELGRALTRMALGFPRQEVIVDGAGAGVLRCRLRPQVASEFAFTRVYVTSELGGMKLLMIQ